MTATRLRRAVARLAIALAGSALLSTLALAPPAAAAPNQAQYCRERGTPYNWTQASCVEWQWDSSLVGTARITLGGAFNVANVERCTLYFQLKPRTYAGPLREQRINCTAFIKTDPNPVEYSVNWGTGRRSGDVYQQYVWMDILSVTGAQYYSRKYYADVTTTKP